MTQFIPILTSDNETGKSIMSTPEKETIDESSNRIYFYGNISQPKSLRFIHLLHKKAEEMQIAQLKLSLDECPPIHVHINSYGGEVHASFAIADNILDCKVPVYTIVEGVAASGGTIISMAGKKRYIRKHAHMLIHQLAGKHWGQWENLKDDYKNSAAMMELIYEYYGKYSSLKKTKIKSILKHDLYFTAKQYEEFGLVDEIIG